MKRILKIWFLFAFMVSFGVMKGMFTALRRRLGRSYISSSRASGSTWSVRDLLKRMFSSSTPYRSQNKQLITPSSIKVSELSSGSGLMQVTGSQFITPATSKPGWFSGQAAHDTYNVFLETMNNLENGSRVGIIQLLKHIELSGYNPINIPDESGHTLLYYLLGVLKKENREASGILVNEMQQDIRLLKTSGAALNEFDREEIAKKMQAEYEQLVAAINNKDLATIYNIGCAFEVYDFAGLDTSEVNIDKDRMKEFLAECRKDKSLFSKVVGYGNIVKEHAANLHYPSPEKYYLSLERQIMQDFNKYQAILPIYSFDGSSKKFNRSKPLSVGAKVWGGEGKVIESQKSIDDMISQGELRDYIEKDVFGNPDVKQAIREYSMWDRARAEGGRVLDEKTKGEDKFYGSGLERLVRNQQEMLIRLIDFPGYEQLNKLLKEDAQNKVAKLKHSYETFSQLAKSIERVNLPNDFNSMYNSLSSSGRYVPNEMLYNSLMQQYHPDKLKTKVESREITAQQAKDIEAKIAQLNNMRSTYQKEQWQSQG